MTRIASVDAPGPRTVHAEHCMGTVFTIDIRDDGRWTDAIGSVVAWLHRIDAIFSTFRPDSDISRIRRGEWSVADADPLVAEVLDRCVLAQRETGGFFSAQPYGELDPTGLVKGWSIERASALLREHGAANHAVNGGGDIQTAGEARPGQAWTVGVSDPHDRAHVVDTVTARDLAVATSGVAERGSHIVNPFSGRAPDDLASVTVAGRSLTDADIYATAVFAMGQRGLGWIESLDGFDALLVTDAGIPLRTSGWRHLTEQVGSAG